MPIFADRTLRPLLISKHPTKRGVLMLEYRINEYEVKRVKRGWIVRNNKGGYENHSHFYFSRKAAIRCAKYAARKITRPCEGPYMLEARRRITLDKDYEKKLIQRMDKLEIDAIKGKKDRYINRVVMP